MKSVKPDILGMFGADLSLELLDALIDKGIFNREEAAALLTKVADKNASLDKETSTSANREIADFARLMAQAISGPRS